VISWEKQRDTGKGLKKSGGLTFDTVYVSVSTVEATGFVYISMASPTMPVEDMCAFFESYTLMFSVISRQFYGLL
jgi:hypothetical protein